MSSEKKYSWHKIAETADDFFWQENNLCEIEVKGKKICIAKKGEDVFACASNPTTSMLTWPGTPRRVGRSAG